MNKHLDVFIASGNGAPSLNPLDSDGIINAIHVEQVVGTLVRLHHSGRYQAYIAESWENSTDFKQWTFKIKKGLTCEDGSMITAKSFAQSLHRVIRLIKQHSQMPFIERLEEYDQIDKKDSILGIAALDEYTLRFKFAKKVGSGLLEYLGLPYLGFYCEANFKSDGKWKDNTKLISSAAYRIDNWSGSGPVELKLRTEWFPMAQTPPTSITIRTQKMSEIKAPKERGFIISFLLEKGTAPEGYDAVHLSPSIFHGIVLSPERSEWLKDVGNRRIFRDEFKRQQASIPTPIEGALSVDRFYPHMSAPIESADLTNQITKMPTKPLLILTVANPTKPSQYLTDLVIKTLQSLGIPYELDSRGQNQQDLMKKYRDHSLFDIRPVSVNSGGGIENQLVKFMFCSKLGVAFPDPGQKICGLVDQYETNFGDVVPAAEMTEYIKEFDSIVAKVAAVIPVIKTGHTWLLTPDLSKDSVSPTMGIPYFDLINLK